MVARRVEQMDDKGTRGVAGIAIELGHVKTDLTALKSELEQHHREHAQDRIEQAQRVTATRRFRIGAAAAWLASVSGVVALLVDISSKLH